MTRSKIPISFFALALFTLTGIIMAQEEENLVAQGTGTGATQQEALLAAKRDAIEKGIGMILLSQTEINNFMVQKDQIITKTVGTVSQYEKLSETKTADGLYEVTIKATLSRTTMRQDLAAFHILIESMNKPRVMVLIKETNVTKDEETNNAAETAIIQFLRDPYEFDIIDPQTFAEVKTNQQKMATVSGNAMAAAAIGAQYGAEVIITGSAVAREAQGMTQNLGGMVSVQADVTLKAVNCTTGRVVGTSSGHGARVHISPNTAGTQAIAKASDAAIKNMLDVIIKDWSNQANNGISINLTINGVSAFRSKTAIIQTLDGIANVVAVHERNWDGAGKILTVDIVYKGEVNGFCKRIDGFKLKSGSGSLSVSSMSGNAVTLTAEAL